MSTSTYTVVGMTCSHCVASVTEEVTQVSGVEDVAVELSTGRLTITSTDELDAARVQEAVEQAGYRLASA